MACSSSLAPLASFACRRGRSTAGPFHQRNSTCAMHAGLLILPLSRRSTYVRALLLKTGLAQAFDELRHLLRGHRHVLLDPCDGDIWLQFHEPVQRCAGRIDLASLREARHVISMACRHSVTLLQCLTGEADRLAKALSQVMCGGKADVK